MMVVNGILMTPDALKETLPEAARPAALVAIRGGSEHIFASVEISTAIKNNATPRELLAETMGEVGGFIGRPYRAGLGADLSGGGGKALAGPHWYARRGLRRIAVPSTTIPPNRAGLA
jgi:hypothetical protein